MTIITEQTKKYIDELAGKYKITIEWDKNPDSTFQEVVSLSNRSMKLKEQITVSEFDRLFEQHGIDYNVDRNQEMFLFNALHGIGHFELNLWVKNSGDSLVDRLSNFDQDKKVDHWAFNELVKIRDDFSKNP